MRGIISLAALRLTIPTGAGGALTRIPPVAAFLWDNEKLVLNEIYKNIVPGGDNQAIGFAATINL